MLGDKGYAVGSDCPAPGPLMPYTFRNFLLLRQRRAKRCRRICESTQSNGSQFQSFLCANLPNLGNHFSALFNASHAARCVACHGVRSHAVPVALVGECSIPVI
jgi:hypothetical protein